MRKFSAARQSADLRPQDRNLMVTLTVARKILPLVIFTLAFGWPQWVPAQRPGETTQRPGDSAQLADGTAKQSQETLANHIAVVELFTSQGCNSCPPADALLQQLASRPHAGGQVLVLSFHVDYWNRLGWFDPYSNATSSARQRAYANGFQSQRVYTPQMIVGGQFEFVGSNTTKASQAIKKTLARACTSGVEIHCRQTSQSIEVSYSVTGNGDTDWLHVALVQNAKPIEILRGENKGRRLGHANVVRAFQSRSLEKSSRGTVTLEIPQDFVAADASVIAYVQNIKTMAIHGAVQSAQLHQ